MDTASFRMAIVAFAGSLIAASALAQDMPPTALANDNTIAAGSVGGAVIRISQDRAARARPRHR